MCIWFAVTSAVCRFFAFSSTTFWLLLLLIHSRTERNLNYVHECSVCVFAPVICTLNGAKFPVVLYLWQFPSSVNTHETLSLFLSRISHEVCMWWWKNKWKLFHFSLIINLFSSFSIAKGNNDNADCPREVKNKYLFGSLLFECVQTRTYARTHVCFVILVLIFLHSHSHSHIQFIYFHLLHLIFRF